MFLLLCCCCGCCGIKLFDVSIFLSLVIAKVPPDPPHLPEMASAAASAADKASTSAKNFNVSIAAVLLLRRSQSQVVRPAELLFPWLFQRHRLPLLVLVTRCCSRRCQQTIFQSCCCCCCGGIQLSDMSKFVCVAPGKSTWTRTAEIVERCL